MFEFKNEKKGQKVEIMLYVSEKNSKSSPFLSNRENYLALKENLRLVDGVEGLSHSGNYGFPMLVHTTWKEDRVKVGVEAVKAMTGFTDIEVKFLLPLRN